MSGSELAAQPASTPDISVEKSWWHELPAEVRYVPGKGRGLFARRDMKAEEIVIASQAYIWNVYEQHKLNVCTWCLRDRPQGEPHMLNCQHCNQVAYCSTKCKEADAVHRAYECSVFGEWNTLTKPLTPKGVNEARSLLRVLSTRKWEGTTGFATKPRNQRYGDYQKLHVGKELLEPKSLKHVTEVAEAFFTIKAKPTEPVSELIDILARNRRNAFCEQTFRTYEVIGCSVFVASSLFNHSCESNILYRVQHQGKHDPRAIEWYTDGAVKAGTELTISYLDDTKKKEPYGDRRANLNRTFSFICHCVRCLREEAQEKAPPP